MNKRRKTMKLVTEDKVVLSSVGCVIDKSTGKTKSIFKFSKGKLSRPLSSNQNMFIIKDNSIIKLN